MEKDALRNSLCKSFTDLYDLGLNTQKAGNISAKTGDTMLISPSGISVLDITPDKFVEVEIGSGELTQGEFAPSSEWRFHNDIYRNFPENRAIIHTHSPYATALSCLGYELPPFHYMVANFGVGSIECARYETFGTTELSLSVIDAIKDSKACFLANHGVIIVGATLKDAFDNTLLLEELARIYTITLSIGKPKILSKTEMTKLKKKFKTYGKASDIEKR